MTLLLGWSHDQMYLPTYMTLVRPLMTLLLGWSHDRMYLPTNMNLVRPLMTLLLGWSHDRMYLPRNMNLVRPLMTLLLGWSHDRMYLPTYMNLVRPLMTLSSSASIISSYATAGFTWESFKLTWLLAKNLSNTSRDLKQVILGVVLLVVDFLSFWDRLFGAVKQPSTRLAAERDP